MVDMTECFEYKTCNIRLRSPELWNCCALDGTVAFFLLLNMMSSFWYDHGWKFFRLNTCRWLLFTYSSWNAPNWYFRSRNACDSFHSKVSDEIMYRTCDVHLHFFSSLHSDFWRTRELHVCVCDAWIRLHFNCIHVHIWLFWSMLDSLQTHLYFTFWFEQTNYLVFITALILHLFSLFLECEYFYLILHWK